MSCRLSRRCRRPRRSSCADGRLSRRGRRGCRRIAGDLLVATGVAAPRTQSTFGVVRCRRPEAGRRRLRRCTAKPSRQRNGRRRNPPRLLEGCGCGCGRPVSRCRRKPYLPRFILQRLGVTCLSANALSFWRLARRDSPRQPVTRLRADNRPAAYGFEPGDQADLFLHASHVVPGQPEAVRGPDIGLAVVQVHLVCREDIPSRRPIVRRIAVRLIEGVDDEPPVHLYRLLLLAGVEVDATPKSPLRFLPGSAE